MDRFNIVEVKKIRFVKNATIAKVLQEIESYMTLESVKHNTRNNELIVVASGNFKSGFQYNTWKSRMNFYFYVSQESHDREYRIYRCL